MAKLSDAELLDFCDTVAQAYVDLTTEPGDGTVANKSSKAAANLQATVLAYGDAEKEGDLLNSVRAWAAGLKGAAIAPREINRGNVFEKLGIHLDGLSAALVARAIRVSPDFRSAMLAATGVALDPLGVFSPVVDPLATFDVTAPGAGTYTDGAEVDSTKYAAAHLKLYVNAGGPTAAPGTYSVTCVKDDDTVEIKAVVVAGGTANGTEFDVGIASDRYKDVTLITVAGGTAADQVKVRSVLERATTTKDD